MNKVSRIGDNMPPDPIDEALAPYGDCITEAESWLDGEKVENEEQMKAVDALSKQIKAALKDVKASEESEAKPLYDQWKAAKERFKPTIDDLSRISKGLVALVGDFKAALAKEKAEAERLAKMEADRKAREAANAARAADASDIEAQRAAAEKAAEADAARKSAIAASKDTVKGLRKVTKYVIEDHRAALHWIAQNNREAVTEFIEDYVRKHHKTAEIAGVRVWQEKEAF